MIAGPEGENDLHLQVLVTLARSLVDTDFVEGLKIAESSEKVFALFNQKRRLFNVQ